MLQSENYEIFTNSFIQQPLCAESGTMIDVKDLNWNAIRCKEILSIIISIEKGENCKMLFTMRGLWVTPTFPFYVICSRKEGPSGKPVTSEFSAGWIMLSGRCWPPSYDFYEVISVHSLLPWPETPSSPVRTLALLVLDPPDIWSVRRFSPRRRFVAHWRSAGCVSFCHPCPGCDAIVID